MSSKLDQLSEDIERVRTELEHRKRSRTSIERSKIHILHDIEQTRRVLDQALQAARRAQLDVEEAQKGFDEAMRRLRTTDQSLEQVAEEELNLANQLRDLSHELSRVPRDDKPASPTARRGFYRH